MNRSNPRLGTAFVAGGLVLSGTAVFFFPFAITRDGPFLPGLLVLYILSFPAFIFMRRSYKLKTRIHLGFAVVPLVLCYTLVLVPLVLHGEEVLVYILGIANVAQLSFVSVASCSRRNNLHKFLYVAQVLCINILSQATGAFIYLGWAIVYMEIHGK